MPVEDDYMMVIIPCIAEIAASDTPERVKKQLSSIQLAEEDESAY